jgi:hypothetical protein
MQLSARSCSCNSSNSLEELLSSRLEAPRHDLA